MPATERNTLEVRQIEAFVAVASCGTFVAAANHLRVSQSALTRRIQELERVIGVSVFLRDAQAVRMTAAGFRLLPEAHRLIEAVQRCRASVSCPQGDLRSLRVGTYPLGMFLLPNAVALLRRSKPDIDIEMVNFLPAEAIAGLESGKLDIAFIGAPMTRLRPELRQRTLCRMRLSAAVALSHPLARNAELPWCALDGQTLILPSRKSFPFKRRWIEECLRGSRVHPKSVIEAVDSADPFTLVGDGRSVALVLDDLRQIRFPGVGFILLVDPIHLMDFTVAWHRHVEEPVITQLFEACKIGGFEPALCIENAS